MAQLKKLEDKRLAMETRLPQQLAYVKKEAIREFVSSSEFSRIVAPLIAPCIINDHRIGIAQARNIHSSMRLDSLQTCWRM
ncbi:hypothetical protein Dimus_031636 [Dionaea muscipula]